MNTIRYPNIAVVITVLVAAAGCLEGPRVSPTAGSTVMECDEAVLPLMLQEVEEFHRSYPNASITVRSVEAREAAVNFLNDSVRVIVMARPFNDEERRYVEAAKIDLQEYKIALDAVAVIGHRDHTRKELRLSELDSIFSGAMMRWPGRRSDNRIEVLIGDVNSSTNEIFRNVVMKGKPFAFTARSMSSSKELVEYVAATRNAIGIVGMAWIAGSEENLTVFALGDPAHRPDTTQPIGKFYPPVQAHIYRGYYPITKAVYMYNREILRDVGYGLISFVSSTPGQQIVMNKGLVPATLPVRLVNLTSEQVTTR